MRNVARTVPTAGPKEVVMYVMKEPALGNIRVNWARLLAVKRMPTMATTKTKGIEAPTDPAMNESVKKRLIAGAILERPVTVASTMPSAPALRRAGVPAGIAAVSLIALPPQRPR